MNHTIVDNTLTITLPEGVSEKNASVVGGELFGILAGGGFDDVVMDCAGLKYISSSGLRVLLKAQKKLPNGKQITLRNVSREINEILEMTGFDNIFRITKRVKRIDLSGFTHVSTGINGEIYRGKHDLMVKMYRKDVTIEDVEQERSMAKKALMAGIPTAISYMIVQDQSDRYGIFFEDIKGDSLINIIKQDPDRFTTIAEEFADFVRELHNTDVSDTGLQNMKTRYLKWLNMAEKKNPSINKARFRAMVEAMADRPTFVHGNLNLGNVFYTDDGFILMDMSSCGYGHSVFDLQGIYGSLVAIEIDDPGYCERTFGLSAVHCRTFWKTFIKRYLKSGEVEGRNSYVAGTDDKMVLVDETKLNLLLEEYYILKEQLIDVL